MSTKITLQFTEMQCRSNPHWHVALTYSLQWFISSMSVLIFATLECKMLLYSVGSVCVCLCACRAVYMSPQQGSLLLDWSSSGALSFSSGGSPLAGVKYTWLGEATSSALGVTWSSGWARVVVTSATATEGSSSKGGGSGGGGAGYLLSLAAARWRFRSARVWCDFSRVILSAPSPSADPAPDAGLSWYEALRSMRPPPVHSSPGTEEARETEVPPLPRLDTMFLSAASSSSKRDVAPPPATWNTRQH